MKKISLAILAAVLLMQTMTACGESAPAENTEGTDPAEVTTETTEEPGIRENVPDETFGGREFHMMLDEGTIVNDDFIAEKETGDLLNDTVFRRNTVIENRFDVKLDPVINGYGGDFVKNLNTIIYSGDKGFDVAMGMNNQSTGITGLTYAGCFIDWNDLEYVDLSMPWWDQNVIRDLHFGNKVYSMTGDLNPSTLGNTHVLLFNKTILKNLDIEFPYQLVLDGKWTYDVFAEMVAKGLSDLNGDGVYSYKDDQFGYTGWQWDLGESIYCGLGGNYVTKDKDNMPVLNLNNDITFAALDKMIALFAEGAGGWQNSIDWGIDIDMFNSGRAMFINSRLYLLNNYREMTDDFGILPHPKMDEGQKEYYQSVDGVCTLIYVPVTCEDPRFTSIMLEAIAAESSRTVMPAYYEVILHTKYARDEESEDMIDIIKNSRFYPLQLKSFSYQTMPGLISSQKNTFASSYAAKETAALKELEDVINAYK